MSDLVRLLLLCLAVELASTAVGVVMTDMSSVVVMVAMLCGPAPTVTLSPIITALLGVHDLLSK
jgi:hypothetical protein